MRSCVIGGGGFIGGYLVDALNASGRDVLVLGRRSDRPHGLHPRATYRSCDYGDRNSLRKHIVECEEKSCPPRYEPGRSREFPLRCEPRRGR